MCKSLSTYDVRFVREENRLIVHINGEQWVAPIPSESSPMGTLPNGTPLNAGKLFSTIEVSILRAATHDWQTAAEFAEKTGQSCTTWFRNMLSNLVDREWLEGGRSGYRRRKGINYAHIDGSADSNQ